MSLNLDVALVTDGLLGGEQEFQPHLAYWGTWGTHRIARTAPLAATSGTLGPFTLPTVPVVGKPGAALRADTNIWFKEIAATHCSGIASIDAIERKYVARDLLEGCNYVSLHDVLVAALQGKSLDVPLYQRMLEVQLSAEGGNDAANAAQLMDQVCKGTLRVTPRLDEPAAARRQAQSLQQYLAAAAANTTILSYNTETFQQAHLAQVNATINDTYAPAFFAAANGGAPDWPIGAETSLERLHLPRFMSDQGSQPPVAFLLHDVETRDHPPGSDIHQYADHYALTADSVRFYEDLLAGAIRREGFASPAEFVAAVQAHESQPASATTVSDPYLRACMAVQDVGTYVANAMYYKSDAVWKNRAYYQRQLATRPAGRDFATPLRSMPSTWRASIAGLRAHAAMDRRSLGSARVLAVRLASSPSSASAPSPVGAPAAIEMESFDTAPVQGMVNSGDCEDMSNMGSTVLRMLPRVAAHPAAQSSAVLQAANQICARRLVLDVAASVTAAFVNTEGKEMSADEFKAMKDLPLIGSAEDARKKEGGHCHGLWQSKAGVYDMLVRAHGKARVDADLPALAKYVAAAPASDRALPTLVLEGTSSIDSLILPAGEISPAAETRATTRRNLIKAVRADCPTLVSAMKMEGLGFYSARPTEAERRRISTFYLGIAHVMSPELYAMNPLYGQLTTVDAARHTRGLEIGAYLRAALPEHAADQVTGLVPTFYALGRERWEREVRPVMAVIQNQMPLNAFARFASRTDRPAGPFDRAHLAQNHVVDLGAFSQLASAVAKHGLSTPAMAAALEGHAQRMQSVALAQGPGANVIPTTPTTSLCFYSRPWRLAIDPQTAANMGSELASLKARGYLTDYRLVHDRPLPHADDVVTLEMTLAVPGPGAPAHAPATQKVGGGLLEAAGPAAWFQLGTTYWQPPQKKI